MAAILGEAQIDCATAANGEEALRTLGAGPIAAVFADLHMPGMSGVQLLERVRPQYPDIAFLMVTGMDDIRVGVEAMRKGADDYLVKPVHSEVVLTSLRRALEKKQLEKQLEDYKRHLEAMVQQRTAQLEASVRQLERSYGETLQALGAAIDLRDSPTAGHSHRVALYSLRIANEMSATEQDLKTIAMGAWLHDIGKLAIPDAILLKPGALTKEEWRIMRSHVDTGYDLVKRIPFLAEAAEIILAHHERWDGSGYPRGLKGTQIAFGARVFAVADTVDAMTSDRPYRSALPLAAAREEIRLGAESRYDSQVASTFLAIPAEEWEGIRLQSASV
jgi:putative nucleotidyltransferase with HDIG domain